MPQSDNSGIDLQQKFPDLEPITSLPSVWQYFGCGFGLYGERAHDSETGTFIKTHCLTLLEVPLFAFAAYRVAVDREGTYLLGRQPLSRFAFLWNCLFLVSIFTAIGTTAWTLHANSPETIAAHKISRADELLDSGELAAAARLYGEVAAGSTSHAATASDKFRRFLQGSFREMSPEEAIAILEVAVRTQKESAAWDDEAELREVAMEMSQKLAAADPRSALAVLDTVAHLIEDAEDLAARRQQLLEAIVQNEPDDPEAASQLAVLYEAQGEMDKCEQLLASHGEQLGIHEGARILGQIHAARGEHDEAVALLFPYTDGRLKKLRAAEQALTDTLERAQQRVIDELESGDAPEAFYARWEDADEATQQEMIWEYVQGETKDDPVIKQRQEELLHEAPVVPVALDLGIALLQRAQGRTDPDRRRTELEKAEEIFLAVRGIAGETDQYRLSLGQVYFWLGKHDEGQKLFEELLDSNDRSFDLLMAVCNTMREIGSPSEASALAEEAYDKADTDGERSNAAYLRAIIPTDLDDSITWLRRANQSDSSVKAKLSSSMAEQALRDGKEAEAAEHLRDSIEIYASQPESMASLNNAALDYFALFRITGDSAALEDGTAMLEEAVAMSPSDSILLGNAAAAILEGAMRNIIADAVDLQTLKMGGSIDCLPYLYEEQAGQAPYIDRVRADAGVTKALDYYEKTLVLAPKRASVYAVLASIYEFTRDVPSLRNLLERIEQSDPDLSDQIRQTHEYYEGKRDETMGKDVDSAIARLETILAAATENGGATLAIAAGTLVGQMKGASLLGRDVDLDRLVDLAERAHGTAPSASTSAALVGALCLRAGRTLAAQEPAYAEMAAKVERSVGHGYLLATILSQEGELRDAVIANPDIQRIVALSRESLAKFPSEYGPFDWVMLQSSEPESAEKLAEIFRGNEVAQLVLKIERRLAPASGTRAIRSYFASRMLGDEEAAQEVLRRCKEEGVPLPVDVK